MGIEALTRTADGAFVVPMSDAEWDDWVSASAARNYVLGDPLLDWLERCGEEHGFRPDDAGSFDVRTDFLTFIFRKGAEFESAVVDHLRTLVEVTTILGAPAAHAARRDLAVAEATFEAMCAQAGVSGVVVPAEDVAEARLVAGVAVYGLDRLEQLREDPAGWPEPEAAAGVGAEPMAVHDLSVVRGQEHVKRALEVATAGGHNVMLQGPPGSGKTLLARVRSGLLPPLTPGEALEVTKVYSVAGMLGRGRPLATERPFRAPHHTISHAGLVGGGSRIRPGEVSLAHRGVLFLDEFPEFGATALEALREPLEAGAVTISRVRGAATFPARFLLIAAMNPCHREQRPRCRRVPAHRSGTPRRDARAGVGSRLGVAKARIRCGTAVGLNFLRTLGC